MTDEVAKALGIVQEACSSVTANLATHQTIQSALSVLQTALTSRVATLPTEPAKAAQNAK